MIILTLILFSNLSAVGFKFKTDLTTYHLPLAEENDRKKCFLQSANLQMYMELTT